MKTIIVAFICLLICANIYIITDKLNKSTSSEPVTFIWNDDEESIPIDGSLVKIEFSEGTTIYLTSIE